MSASVQAVLDKAAARAARLAKSDAVDGPAEAQVAEPVKKKRRPEVSNEELASDKAKSRRLTHGCLLPFNSHDSQYLNSILRSYCFEPCQVRMSSHTCTAYVAICVNCDFDQS